MAFRCLLGACLVFGTFELWNGVQLRLKLRRFCFCGRQILDMSIGWEGVRFKLRISVELSN